MARDLREDYIRASKKEKSQISRDLVKKVHAMDPPGRFLLRNRVTLAWEIVDIAHAREKASQCLRDAACSNGRKPLYGSDGESNEGSITPKSLTPVPYKHDQGFEKLNISYPFPQELTDKEDITYQRNEGSSSPRSSTTVPFKHNQGEDNMDTSGPSHQVTNDNDDTTYQGIFCKLQDMTFSGQHSTGALLETVEPLLKQMSESKRENSSPSTAGNSAQPLIIEPVIAETRRPHVGYMPTSQTPAGVAEDDDDCSLPSVSAHSTQSALRDDEYFDLFDNILDKEHEDPTEPAEDLPNPKRTRAGTWDHYISGEATRDYTASLVVNGPSDPDLVVVAECSNVEDSELSTFPERCDGEPIWSCPFHFDFC
jgi:hypothetical protein